MNEKATATEQDSREPILDHLTDSFSEVLGNLRKSMEEIRQAAQREVQTARAEHLSEKQRLEGELSELRLRHAQQEERLQSLREEIKSLLSDYRGELETQIQKAYSARRQYDRIQELIGGVDRIGVIDAADSKVVPAVRLDRNAPASQGDQQRAAEAGDGAVTSEPSNPGISADAPQQGAPIRIAIKGVGSVSAMMRARKAVESAQGIGDIQSRYVSDGTLYFSVRSSSDAQTLADTLTALPDPPMRAVEVTSTAVQLEM